MIEDSEKYLKNIGKRVFYYVLLKKHAIRYIKNHQIKNNNTAVAILLNTALWGAYQLKEHLTQHDLYDIFGLAQVAGSNIPSLELSDEHKEMSLAELLDGIKEENQ